MSDYYVLDANGDPVEEPDVRKWSEWFSRSMTDAQRVLGKHTFEGGVELSTVFLALDHGFGFLRDAGRPYAPILWETMIFGGPLDGSLWRYTSRRSAQDAHAMLVDVLGVLLKGEATAAVALPLDLAGQRAIRVRD